MKITVGQIEVQAGNPRANKQAISQAISLAKLDGAQLLLLPEMTISGYIVGDAWDQAAFIRECESIGEWIREQSDDLAIIFGNVAVDHDKLGFDGRPRRFNALFACHHKEWVSPADSPYPFVVKSLSPNYRFFAERRYFHSLCDLAFESGLRLEHLLGPLEFTWDSGETLRIAPLICEDSWTEYYPVNPLQLMMSKAKASGESIDFAVNISASPFSSGKGDKRDRLLSKAAKEAGIPLVYVNPVGIQNNGKSVCIFDGQSTIYGGDGVIVHKEAAFTSAASCLDYPFPKDAAKLPYLTRIEERYAALRYGLEKFLEHINMKRVVIGVSGGIDSALSAALYTDILGSDNVYLLTMPSRYNSKETRDLAMQLAANLRCPFATVPISTSVTHTTNQIERLVFMRSSGAVDLRLSYLAPSLDSFEPMEPNHQPQVTDFVKENIQARDRSSRILAAVAASLNCGFTCNGNKTELSVGYATLYGDMAGIVAALGDLWKHEVYELASYVNSCVFRREVIPLDTLTIVPSAELSAEQDIKKGKGDPFKYEYHDRLFAAFVEPWNRLSPEDLILAYKEDKLQTLLKLPRHVNHYFPTAKEWVEDLERWWERFSGIGVAKRIQTPPIIVLSRRAFGGDYQEAQMKVYYTDTYKKLRAELLGEKTK